MNRPPRRFLFQIHNRRGLGHMMRGLNIAREIRSLAPASDILFYAKSPSAEALCDRDFRYFVETDYQGLSHWPEVVRSFSPDVIIYDTLLPKDPAREPVLPSARYVYIMRKCQAATQREIFSHPFLDQIDLILIPHTPIDFSYDLPSPLEKKSCFVGPIVRLPDKAVQERLRETYQIGVDDFLLTSTVGGGGLEDKTRLFFAAIFETHRLLYSIVPHLRHLVIQGPNFRGSLTPLRGMTVVPYEAELVNLMAISKVVIAAGGYNTVNEIRVTKTPAIFLPIRREQDDQEERVRALEKRGLAVVFPEVSPEEVSPKIAEICASESYLNDIRKRYETDRMELGNRAAAEKIVGLVSR